jgi:GT2 family glycosyltransferase
MASALLARRAALDEVGLLDTQFPIFFGDVDLCLRLKEGGWEVWYTPDARMTHFGGASTRQVRRDMIIESHASFQRFYEKHYRGRFGPVSYWLALALLRVGRAVRLARADVHAWLNRARQPAG